MQQKKVIPDGTLARLKFAVDDVQGHYRLTEDELIDLNMHNTKLNQIINDLVDMDQEMCNRRNVEITKDASYNTIVLQFDGDTYLSIRVHYNEGILFVDVVKSTDKNTSNTTTVHLASQNIHKVVTDSSNSTYKDKTLLESAAIHLQQAGYKKVATDLLELNEEQEYIK